MPHHTPTRDDQAARNAVADRHRTAVELEQAAQTLRETTAVAGHEALGGCDDCSVEPGECHRYVSCPGNQREAARQAPGGDQ